ncbi:peroxisomal N(1)-acetyl-spermine/spermidine oxidase-like [Chanos chanos]|uniref:Peroxisomal N(1)-acetyl-spermine/spermidine oxidase-like n=1 Tax=Chanos chanos TaxID=29144 RepID=A0A6J2WIH3_CHACN|nr:peroxisomal N(1)-acetyl-spermine/spermidine oxidase-like [Chanos chanos]
MSSLSHRGREARIVIVGAGFAGLSAAETLVKAGFQNVQVLEAMGRLGGRAYTMRPFSENIIELGANWIHGQKGNPLFQLAQEHGLLSEEDSARKSVSSRNYFFKEGGKQLATVDVDKMCSLFDKLTAKAFDSELEKRHRPLSLGDYLDRAFAETRLAASEDRRRIFEWCKRNECTDEACSSLYEVSASQISEYTDLKGEFFNCLGPGGYQALLDLLLKSLPPEAVLKNQAVETVQWDLKAEEQGQEQRCPVRVVCENGESYEADHVIVTVSLGVLKERARTMFTPALPKSKLCAVERLGFGTVDKIYLQFSERFWPEDCAGIQLVWNQGPEDKDVYSCDCEGESWKDTWFKKICGFDTVARHPTVLCGWITGREALYMESLRDSEVRDVCVRLLESFTGWAVPEVCQVLVSRWGHDPFVSGAYSFIPKNVNGVQEQKALSAPLPPRSKHSTRKPLQVLFAGEATHVNFYTTTHGAYLSGVREAQRLISHYAHKTQNS